VLRKHVPASTKSWADFGCSSGFIFEEVEKTGAFSLSRMLGFDCEQRLLDRAKAKNIRNAEFKWLDLNQIVEVDERFDLVSCFETLEHVGNYRNAFRNLFMHLSEGGILVISVPNEIGPVGLLKFVARMIVRRNAYRRFFDTQSRFRYALHLIADRDVECFRRRDQCSYGPHLGFDYRKLKEHIEKEYLHTHCLHSVAEVSTILRENRILVFQKQAALPPGG
jgi:2-polyprenyl-3-methyl-5-hydroxy-6-metoxy-1,4-benzoquinol methylase